MSTAAPPDPNDPVAVAVAQAVGQAVAEVAAQFGQLMSLTDTLWRAKAYLAASLTLLGWDILVTLHLEYQRFWKPAYQQRKVTPVTFAFTFIRYWCLFTLSLYMALFYKEWSPKACSRLHWLEPICGIVLFSFVQFLIGARVWAIWEQNRLVLVAFGATWATGLALQIWAIVPNTNLLLPPGVPGCIDAAAASNADTFWVFWLSPLLFDALAIALTLTQMFTYYRSSGKMPLLVVIVRDGLAYFLGVFALNLLNTLWFKSNRIDHALHGPLTLALTTILVSRMFLNLRAPGLTGGTSNYGSNSSGSYALSSQSRSKTTASPLVAYPTNLPNASRTTLPKEKLDRDSFDFPV